MAKRRANGEGTYFKRGTKWIGRVTTGYNALGKQVRKQVSGDKLAEVRAQCDEIKRQLRQGSLPTGLPDRVAVCIQEWLDTSQKIGPTTRELYESLICNHINPSSLAGIFVNKLTATHVEMLLKDMADRGVSGRVRQQVRQILYSAFKRAVKHRKLAANPCEAVDVPRATSERPAVAFTREEVQLILSAASSDWSTYPIFVLAVTSGCRQGELFGLRWPRLDLDAGRLDVVESLYRPKGGHWKLKVPKNHKRRQLDLAPGTVAVLRQHKARLEAEGLYDPTSFVFPACRNADGKLQPFHKSNFCRRTWKPVLKAADLGRLEAREAVFHHLRHTCGSLMLSNGVALPAVSRQLGHKDASITAKVYSHEIREDRTEAVRQLDEQLITPLNELRLVS